MKVVLVSLNNGLSYEDNEIKPVVVCANKQKALEYIDSHPITKEFYKKVFYYYPVIFSIQGRYELDDVEVYQ